MAELLSRIKATHLVLINCVGWLEEQGFMERMKGRKSQFGFEVRKGQKSIEEMNSSGRRRLCINIPNG